MKKPIDIDAQDNLEEILDSVNAHLPRDMPVGDWRHVMKHAVILFGDVAGVQNPDQVVNDWVTRAFKSWE